ncbi:MAG: NAD(P)/FAD-dependent oxidoreductase [Desulfobulbaceae bacterium]|nr:NAD(P)/FAD-dependent oxidoreductase [Desulfobulbaceae bacterium]
METFDAIIIGAGPGGLRCATILASHGLKTLVLERKTEVGPKVCAGGIPFHALAKLHVPDDLHEASFPTQIIQSPWQQAKVHFKEPVITTVNRERFAAWQLDEACKAGAIIRTASAVTAISGAHLTTTHGEIAYHSLIGADGSASIVRRHLGLGSQHIGVGINYQLPEPWPAMEWHLDPKRFNSGYAWIFPHRRTTSVGAYACRNDLDASTLHHRLLAWAKIRGIDLSAAKAKAALINFDYQGWNFAPVYLVGDAAGLASGFTGEGIFPAIVSGETVARTILDPCYQPILLTRLLRRQRMHNRLQKFYSGNKVLCQISLEMLVLAIRLKVIGFEVLEMY